MLLKLIACIPAHGRLPLLEITIRRLLEVNKCSEVIVSGSNAEKKTITAAGGIFIEMPNAPLGAKWNRTFQEAKKYNPDGCVYMGSSDWITKDWCENVFNPEEDISGVLYCNFVDVSDHIRVAHWEGYKDAARKGEPIGLGRVLSSEFLSRIRWSPFEDSINNSLDWSMWQKAKSVSVKDKDINQPLSISTNKWVNKHKFDYHWNDNKNSNPKEWLERHGFLDDIMELKKRL